MQRCLDPAPENRFPSMAAFVDAVKKVRIATEYDDPIRRRAELIGYDPTTPIQAEDVVALRKHLEATDPKPETERLTPPPDVQTDAATIKMSPIIRTAPTPVADPQQSNTLAWVVIVVASLFIVGSSIILIFGLGIGDEAVTVHRSVAGPHAPKSSPEPPPPPETKPDKPKPEPEPPVTPPSSQTRIARGCAQGRGADCTAAGNLFLTGKGVEKSVAEALSLFKRACHLKSMAGCVKSGDIMSAQGHHRDARRAYERACDSGVALACAKLSDLWREGAGGRQSHRTADAFQSRACKLGRSNSCK